MLYAFTSLALASLGWCAREFAPETTTDDLIRRLSVLDTEALAPFSQLALREAVQELLAAIADTDDESATGWLNRIARILPNQPSLARLDAMLGGTPDEWRSLLDAESEEERGVIVAARLIVWLRQLAPESLEPPSLEHLLALGWTAPGCAEFHYSFYRAYCLALHDDVRHAMGDLEPVVLGARLEPQQWFEWLGSEAGLPPVETPGEVPSSRRQPLGAPTVAAVVAATIAAVWWLASAPHHAKPRAAPTQSLTSATEPKIAPSPPSTPGATPTVTLSGTPAPQFASSALATPPPDPVSHARLLIADAKREMAEGDSNAADVDARSAQELLETLLPVHDMRVGEVFRDVADHWEARQRWEDAARVLQRTVQSYEGTPGENTGPQLEAVNRWAGALRKTGRLTEAEKLYRRLLQAYEGTGPSLEVDAATVAHNLANAMVDKGRFPEARGYYERALSLLANHWPTEDEAQRLAAVMGQNYQRCLIALGFQEKEALAQTRRLLKLPSPTGGK